MKTILKIILAMFLAASASANTNLLWLDYTTPHGSGVYGDSWPVSANKINANFSNVLGLIVGGTIGGGSNFYSYTNYVTTNLYLTQNNYSYTTTNIYTGAITFYTNVYTGSNYFNNGSNVYITSTTNYFATYYTGGSSNTIEKFNGGGVDTTITNTLTLVNTNIILGWNANTLITVSTNQFGVYQTNLFVRTNFNSFGFQSTTNGDIIIFLPLQPVGTIGNDPTFPPVSGWLTQPDGTMIPTNFTPVRGYTAMVVVDSNIKYPNSGQPYDTYYYTSTNPLVLNETAGLGAVDCQAVYSSWLISHVGWDANYEVGTENPPPDGKIYSGNWQYSDQFYAYKVQFWGYEKPKPFLPTNFIPDLSANAGEQYSTDKSTLPIRNWVVLRPQYDLCGNATNYQVIGWNPFGDGMSGWNIISNALGYAPIVTSACSGITTNWIVYHQGVWIPWICNRYWQASGFELLRHSTLYFPQLMVTNYGVRSVGVNLNQTPPPFVSAGTGASHVEYFYDSTLAQFGIPLWFGGAMTVFQSDPQVYNHLPNSTDEPSLTGMADAVWQGWHTNRTATATNYAVVLKTSTNVILPPMPTTLVSMLNTPATPNLITNITSTNQFVILTNIIVNAQPIYQRTTLYSKDDSTIGVNYGTPLITYTGKVEESQISSNAVSFLQSYPSNTWNLSMATNGMADGGFRTVNSNGAALVDLWMSNGVIHMKSRW